MAKVLGYISSLFGALGSATDAAVPVATGNRTVGAVLLAAGLNLLQTYGPSLISVIPPPYGAAVSTLAPVVMAFINQLLAILTPLFAVAHVTRPSAPAAS